MLIVPLVLSIPIHSTESSGPAQVNKHYITYISGTAAPSGLYKEQWSVWVGMHRKMMETHEFSLLITDIIYVNDTGQRVEYIVLNVLTEHGMLYIYIYIYIYIKLTTLPWICADIPVETSVFFWRMVTKADLWWFRFC